MEYIAYAIICVFLSLNMSAQAQSSSDADLARASLYHLQKDFGNAIQCFETAFKVKSPDALNAYKAAAVYSLDSNAKMSAYYLQKAIQAGWAEASWLVADPYFEYFKQADPITWNQLITQAKEKELVYEKKLTQPTLRTKINLMVLSDQQLRYKKIQTKDKEELQDIDLAIAEADKKNLAEAKNILATYGWPKLSEIGKDGQNNLWLIVQHADHDILFQQQVLKKMKRLLKSKEVNLENYAFLTDRVLCNLNYLQEYGTQVNWTINGMANSFRPIRNEWDIDQRRKKLGMTGLDIYSLAYGFTYEKPKKVTCTRTQQEVIKKVKLLIDTASEAFYRGDFQLTYDSYNSASVFSEGMSDRENFKAAVIFATIAARDRDPKYRDISFDFLNLLYLRGKLKESSLRRTYQFETLHDDPRWIKLFYPGT